MRSAVLFDLDGTLVDSLEDIADALNAVLREQGYPTHAVDAYRALVGGGARELVRRALPPVDDATFAPIFARFRAYFAEHLVVRSRPYPGIADMIEELRRARVALGVVSNKPHAAAREVVERLFPSHPFEVVLGQREGIPHKPDPRGLLEALASLGVDARDALFVGDSDVDVWTATNAGAIPVAVAWGFRSREELLAAGARHLVEHPREIVALALADR